MAGNSLDGLSLLQELWSSPHFHVELNITRFIRISSQNARPCLEHLARPL
jgi:hypothetical protein